MNYKVIDLFAGAGGFGLGFELAGFDLHLSIEIDKWAVDTLLENHNKERVLLGSVKDDAILKKAKRILSKDPDVIIGGPPCQGFSYANSKSDPKDPRNTLFMDYARWVEKFKPKVFVMENVSGILNRKNAQGDDVIKIIKHRFESIGYHVDVWLLNAAEYGVPQARSRVFIVGNKIGKAIAPPNITHYIPEKGYSNIEKLKPAITVHQAISDLPIIKASEGAEEMEYTFEAQSEYQKLLRKKSSKVYNHVAMKHTKRLIGRYQHILDGDTFDNLPSDLKVLKRNGNGEHSDVKFQSNYRHLKPDSISFTIPASFYSNFIHPTIPRNITSREAARIQSFPDYYKFKGLRTQVSSQLLKKIGREDQDHLSQYNQIGNAVPPLLAKAIAKRINSFLKKHYPL